MNAENTFGFGTMRMPVLDKNDPSSFDYEKIEKLFDRYMEKGFTYFDTAYTYHGYKAESCVKRALVDRYPRKAFEIATKMPLRDFKDEADLEVKFNEQLNHLGVDYFDYYLLHNIGYNVIGKCEKYHAFDFVRKKKEEGLIRNLGFSFHDTPELLDKILSKYASYFDFVQLQVNYIDMDQVNVRSKDCLEVVSKYHLPVIVMEPCKGGTLVNVPEEAEKLFREFNPKASPASYAFRYALSQKGVVRVLSGMNSLEQVEENCNTFLNFRPLSEEELKLIEKVKDILLKNTEIPCTSCSYCTHGCPKKIPIPSYFGMYNSIRRTTGDFSSQGVYYRNAAFAGYGKASDCIGCGQCEKACPQHIAIREMLKKVKDMFEK